MRLFEVGTKALAAGNKKDAYDLFDRSYNLYCIFWGLNMGMINGTDVKWVKSKNLPQEKEEIAEEEKSEPDTKVSKLKAWVKNAVNCCIE